MNTQAVGALVLCSLLAGCGSSVDVNAFGDDNDSGSFATDSGGPGSDTGTTMTTDSGTTSDSGAMGSDTAIDTFDPSADKDGDGYLAADDCNDSDAKVNPGAFDVPDDKIDNDCNGKVDDESPCDEALALDASDPADLAKAIGLCRTTTETATGKAKTWGLLAAKLTRADGSGTPNALQHGVFGKFGKNVDVRQGKKLLVLSSGTARMPMDPGYVKPATGFSDTNETAAPTGFPRSAPGCPTEKTTQAYDGISLELEVRVPTNAKGFKLAHDFYTSEYVEFACGGFDDQFLVLLDSKAPLDAKYAGNVVFDAMGANVTSSTSLLEVCTPGMNGGKSWSCPQGKKELEGTGFDDPDKPANGAATGWLETHAQVVPGETITVRVMVFDAGDHILDSSVLLDAFRWTTTGPDVPVTTKAMPK